MIKLRWPHIVPLAALVLGSELMAAPASAATSGTFTASISQQRWNHYLGRRSPQASRDCLHYPSEQTRTEGEPS
jgi:hypothetical protein